MKAKRHIFLILLSSILLLSGCGIISSKEKEESNTKIKVTKEEKASSKDKPEEASSKDKPKKLSSKGKPKKDLPKKDDTKAPSKDDGLLLNNQILSNEELVLYDPIPSNEDLVLLPTTQDPSKDDVVVSVSNSKPGTNNTPGTGNKPGTDSKPGTENKPGTDNTPGSGNEPGTDNTPGTGNKPGTDNTPGTGNEPETHQHSWGNWSFRDNEYDVRTCSCGEEQVQPHQFGQETVQITSNNEVSGTHKVQSSKTCNVCKETVSLSRDEDCIYTITYNQTGINDTHIEVKDCELCGSHQETQGTCVPCGELKLVKIYAQIYEYFSCELCGDMCKRTYHTNHQFGDWEYRDSQSHIRYCLCIEARETANHNYIYDGSNSTCQDCGNVVQSQPHDHGHGVYDNMDLMELVMSPAYQELVSHSQIPNPNPSADSYCSRYDFCCKTCNTYYHVYYSHSFENGVCSRTGYCGGISQYPTQDTESSTVDPSIEDSSSVEEIDVES